MTYRRKAVFLDRDGVLNRKAPEGAYIQKVEDFHILPGSVEALCRLKRAGYLVIVVTNQRGIARGLVSRTALGEMHEALVGAVTAGGGHIDAIYVCPHDFSDNCSCRKPHPGMLLQAAADHALDMTECWMVGDRMSDIEAGIRAGCRSILVAEDCREMGTIRFPNLTFAVEYILGAPGGGRTIAQPQASTARLRHGCK